MVRMLGVLTICINLWAVFLTVCWILQRFCLSSIYANCRFGSFNFFSIAWESLVVEALQFIPFNRQFSFDGLQTSGDSSVQYPWAVARLQHKGCERFSWQRWVLVWRVLSFLGVRLAFAADFSLTREASLPRKFVPKLNHRYFLYWRYFFLLLMTHNILKKYNEQRKDRE